ncbi:MAG: hypothetical protein HOQ24_16685, partial [Mycobacteriaceae bacterium]|nr:hypothetical protein [Mycobacteriaceae bacterium]
VVGPGFSADGTLMVTGSVGLRANTLGEGNIQVWNTADPHRPRRIGELAGLAPITDLKVAPDGRTVATVDQSASTVRLFDLSAPEALRPLTDLALPARYTYALAFRPDSRVLLTQHDDHAIRLWDLSDRARPAPLGDPLVPLADGFVTAAEFSPDGGVLAMASGGRGVLWDVSDPLRPRQIGHPFGIGTNAVRRLAFSPDGHTLVTGGDDGLRLWDIAVPARPELVGGPLATHSVASLAVSPDGGLVASGGDDAAVRLWDISDRGRPKPIRHSLALASTPSWKVAFHPGGRAKPTRAGVRSAGLFLAGSGESGVLRMWNLDAARAAARICEVTRSILTPATWRRVLPQLRYDPPCA